MILVSEGSGSHAGRVTTEDVMLAILELTHEDAEAKFTTLDVAQEMGVDEYPVRAAFWWLRKLGKIQPDEKNVLHRLTRTAGERYEVTVYRIKPKAATSEEFQAFYARFCGGR
jgi:hypothetical protein